MHIFELRKKTNTGLSPAEILFDNAVDHGRRILHTPVPSSKDTDEPLSDYFENMLSAQASLITIAQETQLKHDTHHMSTFDKNFTGFP